MAKGDYTIENIYEPGYSSFIPGKDSPYLGKQNLMSAQQLGMTVDPRTANQLGELSRNLNVGIINFELGTMDMPTFDTIPKQHLEEIRRKAKLAEAKISLHAPIQAMDPAGFGERGWEEGNQQLVERQLKTVIDRAAIIDPTGNMPVTIHGSNSSGSTFKMVDGNKQYDQLIAVDKATGQMTPLKESRQYNPLMLGEDSIMTPEDALKSANQTQWRKEVDSALFEKEHADRILKETYPVAKELYAAVSQKPELFHQLPSTQKQLILDLQTANAHIKQAQLNVESIFDKAYQYGGNTEDEKKIIKENLRKAAERYEKTLFGGKTQIELNRLSKDEINEILHTNYHDLQTQSQAIQNLAEDIRKFNPSMLQTVEDFSKDKGSETFANVALHSFKKYGEGAPVISVENLYQGMGFSQGKDLKELVEQSQKKFVEKAVKDEGLSRSEAEKMAKKLIGVTFDVGHLNVSKGRGFEDKHLVKEAEELAKHVKHIHITDNFGFSDTHLPMGMGNVPVEKLLDALGERGKKLRKINEVGGWFQHFKTNPFPQILEAAGSQIYSSGQGPYWSQAGGFQQSYNSGYGMMLPQKHYETFGSGFSQLPQELGGQVGAGAGGRMGGDRA